MTWYRKVENVPRSVIVGAVLLLLAGCAGPRQGGQEDIILIGEYGSLTGLTATYGISTKNAIEMAMDEANDAHFVGAQRRSAGSASVGAIS